MDQDGLPSMFHKSRESISSSLNAHFGQGVSRKSRNSKNSLDGVASDQRSRNLAGGGRELTLLERAALDSGSSGVPAAVLQFATSRVEHSVIIFLPRSFSKRERCYSHFSFSGYRMFAVSQIVVCSRYFKAFMLSFSLKKPWKGGASPYAPRPIIGGRVNQKGQPKFPQEPRARTARRKERQKCA